MFIPDNPVFTPDKSCNNLTFINNQMNDYMNDNYYICILLILNIFIMDEQEIKQKPKFFLQPNKSALLQSGLQYRDVLTYGTLLSFCNKDLECYPSFRTLAERSKLSVGFLSSSVERLRKAEWITIEKKLNGKRSYNYYKCKPFDDFKMVPTKIFQSDLKAEDLATLLCIRQFYYDETLVTDINIVEMSDILGVSYSVLYQRYNILKKKGYITIKVKNNTSLSKLEDRDFEWKVSIEKKLNDTYDITKKNSEEIEMLKTLLYKSIKGDKKQSKEEYFKSLTKN